MSELPSTARAAADADAVRAAAAAAAAAGTPASTTRAPAFAPPWRAPLVVLVLGGLAMVALPDQLGLVSRIAITALLVLSLDLVVGVAGLATLGHAAMFGVGAYAAGMLALRGLADPLAGLALAAAAGAAVAALSGAFLLRYSGFTFLMLTVAVAQILQNLASKWRDLTGGDDGLTGFTMGPLLGRFEFDLEGRVAAVYAIVVLAAGLYLARRLVDSPFGLAVRGVHENRTRMAALGTPVFRRLLAMYTAAGALAGVAGALSAQTNAIVGLDSLGFALSAEALEMLVLGGAGRLHGALIGATVFTLLHHTAAAINPYHWLFVIGAALMIVVLLPRQRLWAALRARLPGAIR